LNWVRRDRAVEAFGVEEFIDRVEPVGEGVVPG
jgi:hypothetical protein